LDLEHQVALIVKEQEEKDSNLMLRKQLFLLADWRKRLAEIEEELQEVFRPIVTDAGIARRQATDVLRIK
jgi:hypothetical protein